MMKRRPSVVVGLLALLIVLLAIAVVLSRSAGNGGPSATAALPPNQALDPGTPIAGVAHDFTLVDQFGRRVSLRSYRGRVVILAFNDSRCTTVCPLTTTAMVEAKQLLGGAGRSVALLGVDANPSATAVEDVRAYSVAHGMLHRWRFLTGSPAQLKRVWKAYGIAVDITRGQIDHTPVLFVISPQGRLEKVYLTAMAYASIGQFGQELAREASSLLPSHPPVRSKLSYGQVASVGPTATVSLPRAGGGSVRLGPGGARLRLFFATWVAQTSDLAAQLEALNGYRSAAAARGLPPVSAVDEASVEPSAGALARFLASLPHRLSYPVAIDRSGRVADGYEVQDEPWLVLTSRAGRIIWYYDLSTQGPLTAARLISDVGAALTAPPKAPPATSPAATSGSPGQLSALRAQGDQLLGSDGALLARIHALHGYPIVINAWASWCPGCRQEFPLFASAAARYGTRVAFLGVDTEDPVVSNARAFLATHHTGYPSYQSPTEQIGSLAALEGLPSTIFVNCAGKIVSVHTGPYLTQGTLDQDIGSYARGC
jgi:cytochrome oxidase Cu insertion factor (SCO1/SenC/PrrC family)/thiol-disulfide isomerase/thioredoxin